MTNQVAIISTQDIQLQARAIVQSGLFSIKTESQAMALMLIAQAEGRHPAMVALDYDIIGGRPAKRAIAMQRDYIATGGKITWIKSDNFIAEAIFSHPQGGELTETYTIEDAKLAGLTGKDNWRKFPKPMLRARVLSSGIRATFPMATSGMYVPEEVQDFDPKEPASNENIIDASFEEVKPKFNSVADFNRSGLNERWTAEIDACKTPKMLLDWWLENVHAVTASPASNGIQDGILACAKILIKEFDDCDLLREDMKFNASAMKQTPFNGEMRQYYIDHAAKLNAQTEKAA